MLKEENNKEQLETNSNLPLGASTEKKKKKEGKSKSTPKKKNEWYDNFEVKNILKISDSTLARYRKNKKLPYIKQFGKILYPKTFFEEILLEKIENKHLLQKK